jgi:hypothetical protein
MAACEQNLDNLRAGITLGWVRRLSASSANGTMESSRAAWALRRRRRLLLQRVAAAPASGSTRTLVNVCVRVYILDVDIPPFWWLPADAAAVAADRERSPCAPRRKAWMHVEQIYLAEEAVATQQSKGPP